MNFRKTLLLLCIACFSQSMISQSTLREKIRNSVEFRIASEKLNLKPGSYHTVHTEFTINNTGELEDITAQAEYPELEELALDILKSLTPEEAPKHASEKKQRIKLPMKFRVETLKQRAQRIRKENRRKKMKVSRVEP